MAKQQDEEQSFRDDEQTPSGVPLARLRSNAATVWSATTKSS